MTWTAGLTMSSLLWIFFGLPLRTARTTTELVTKPSVLASCDVQLLSTMPGSTSLSTSGDSDSATMSAGRPAAPARDWSPEAPADCVNDTPLSAPGLRRRRDNAAGRPRPHRAGRAAGAPVELGEHHAFAALVFQEGQPRQ